MKKTKIMAAILSLVLAMSVLVGCENVREVMSAGEQKITEPEFNYIFNSYKSQIVSSILSANPSFVMDQNAWDSFDMGEGKVMSEVVRESAKADAEQLIVCVLKAKELGIEVTAEETTTLNNNITSMIDQLGGRSVFEKELKAMGTTEKAYKAVTSNMQLREKVWKAESEKIQVADEDIKKIYDDEYVRVKHVLISTRNAEGADLSQDEITAARTKSEEIFTKAKAGEDFENLIVEYSQDPGSKVENSPNGYIFSKGEMLAEFEEAAFALTEGGISDIVRTTAGFHIIKKYPKSDEASFAEVKDTIKNELIADKVQGAYEEWKAACEIKVNDKYISGIKFK